MVFAMVVLALVVATLCDMSERQLALKCEEVLSL
jgi:hypothetical protein